MRKTKPTRQEILKGMGWEPFKMGPGVPAAVVEAENRRMQDYIVGWAQGMAATIAKVDAAGKGPKQAQRKPAKASPPAGRKRRPLRPK
jgi:hypothetical protein